VFSGLALNRTTHKKKPVRARSDTDNAHRTGHAKTLSRTLGAAGPSKPTPGRLEAI
jgi:hypothetical protein